MRTQSDINEIVSATLDRVSQLYPNEKTDAILFGSYARADADDDSDVDVMILVDSSREVIAERNWNLGAIASDLFMDYGMIVSPIVENRSYFQQRKNLLPFFNNISREGVRFDA